LKEKIEQHAEGVFRGAWGVTQPPRCLVKGVNGEAGEKKEKEKDCNLWGEE